MRIMTFSMMSAALALGAAGPAAAMSPASGTIVLHATATFSDGSSADRLYEVKSDADSDGDGLNDSGWLRVACDGAVVSAVYYTVKSPRDSASGQASGRRMHRPFKIIKEWGPSPLVFGKTGGGGGGGGGGIAGGVIAAKVSWDLVKGKGSRSTDSGQAGAAVTPPYSIKENKPPSVDRSRASDDSAGKGSTGADRKTMAHDSWHEATLKEGSPNLCD